MAGWQDRATSDARALNIYAKRFPRANVGVMTGTRSRLVIIDVDGEQGFTSLEERQKEIGRLPPTVRTRSGREGVGYHLWFSVTDDATCPRNSAGLIGANVDVRGEGGYALIPGCLHLSGRRYAWELSPSEVEFASLPTPWLEFLDAGRQAGPVPSRQRGSARSPFKPQRSACPSREIGDGDGYGGFYAPIFSNACRYFHAQPDAPTPPLITALQQAIDAAPKAVGRDVSRYRSEAYLIGEADRARAFIKSNIQ